MIFFQKKTISLLLAIGAIMLVLSSCSNKADSEPSEEELNKIPYEERLPNISYEILERKDFTREIVSNGTVAAGKKAELNFTISKQIVSINYKNGDRVSSGAIIAKMKDEDLVTDLRNAETTYEEAIINLKDEFISSRLTLEDSANINPDMLQTFKIRSGFLRAQTDLNTARRKIRQTILRAPFSGIIADLNTQPFNLPPTDKPFCVLVNTDELFVNFSIMESEMNWVGEGKHIKIIPYAHDTLGYRGKIIQVNPVIDEFGMIAVKAKVNGFTNRLMDGMHVKVIIENIIADQLVIPKEAMVLRDGREVVFTYKQDSTVYWNYVKPGLENTSSYTILDGLKEGDSVVVEGNFNLAHKTKVNVR